MNPQAGMALNVLGHIAVRRGDGNLAVLLWETATRAAPALPQPWVSLGEAFFHIGQIDKTLTCFREALNRNGELHDVRVNYGIALQHAGRHEDAVNELRRAMVAAPNNAEGATALATSLHQLGRTAQAIDVLEGAARAHPGNAKILSNLGVLHEKSDQLEKAIEWYDRSLAVNPNDAQALFNRGSSRIQLLRIGEARSDWERALALDPKNANVANNLSILELLDGNYGKGFDLFESRWALRHQKFPIPASEWAGEDLNGKHLILYMEQGLGDMLQFCRYVRVLKGKYPKSRVTLCGLPVLHELLKSLEGLDGVVDIHPPYPACDYQLSLLSVPRVLGTRVETIPSEVPYLKANATKAARWDDRLSSLGAKKGKKRIGLFWQGTKVDENRMIRLGDLGALWGAAPDSVFISLQKGAGEEEIAGFGKPIVAVGHELLDYSDTAAVLANLDLVITIDTSLAHAAGAMGREAWTLLPYRPDWRWLLGRTDSPWYPTMRLFRQKARKEWSGVLAEVATELGKWR